MVKHATSKAKTIGILTGGGDCPGINAVIRSVSKTAILEHGWKIIGIADGYFGLIENRSRVLEYEDVSNILTKGGTILGTSNIANPFAYPVEENGTIVKKDLSDQVVKNYNALGLDALVCIGGDGTLSIANRLIKKGLNIVGIPKTIDNDLANTDFTFGFNTAVTIATEAIDRVHTTAQSHHRVMIVEVMGRYAGWLALHSGVAGGADIILIPEIPFDLDKVCQKVIERSKKGKRFSIIVVAEGAKAKGGEMVVKKRVKNSPDPIRLGGVGEKLADDISKRTNIESRVCVLGHVQRGGTPTPFDRVLATRYGNEAVNLIVKKQFGYMVSLKGNSIVPVKVESAVKKLKTVPLDYDLLSTARSVGTSFGD